MTAEAKPEAEQFCPSQVVHDGAAWRCSRKRHHRGEHECIGVGHPKDAMTYRMRWTSPEPYNEPLGEAAP